MRSLITVSDHPPEVTIVATDHGRHCQITLNVAVDNNCEAVHVFIEGLRDMHEPLFPRLPSIVWACPIMPFAIRRGTGLKK